MLEELPKQYQKPEVLVCKLQDDQITKKDVAIVQDHPHLQLERKLFQIVYQMLQKIMQLQLLVTKKQVEMRLQMSSK